MLKLIITNDKQGLVWVKTKILDEVLSGGDGLRISLQNKEGDIWILRKYMYLHVFGEQRKTILMIKTAMAECN